MLLVSLLYIVRCGMNVVLFLCCIVLVKVRLLVYRCWFLNGGGWLVIVWVLKVDSLGIVVGFVVGDCLILLYLCVGVCLVGFLFFV